MAAPQSPATTGWDVRALEERDIAAKGGSVFASQRGKCAGKPTTTTITCHDGVQRQAMLVGAGGAGTVFAVDLNGNGSLTAVKIPWIQNGAGSFSRGSPESPWGAAGSPTYGKPIPRFAAAWTGGARIQIQGLPGVPSAPNVVTGELYARSVESDLASGRPYSDERTAQVAARCMLAVIEAGVVHRDIKPDNILITRDGDVRLADWGLVVRPGEPVTPAFTEMFAAPEQLRHLDAWRGGDHTEKPADPKWDAYQMGLTITQMLTASDARNNRNGVLSNDVLDSAEQTWRYDHGVRATGSQYWDLVVASACRPDRSQASSPIDVLCDVYPLLPEADRTGPDAIFTPEMRRQMGQRLVERNRDWQDRGWARLEWEQDNPGKAYAKPAPLPRTTALACAQALRRDVERDDPALASKMRDVARELVSKDPRTLAEVAAHERSQEQLRAEFVETEQKHAIARAVRAKGASPHEIDEALSVVPSAGSAPIASIAVMRRQVPTEQQRVVDQWRVDRAVVEAASQPKVWGVPQRRAPPPPPPRPVAKPAGWVPAGFTPDATAAPSR